MTLPPLAGFTIGITADRHADAQAQMLQRRGATVMHGPTLRTELHPLDDELLTITKSLIENPPNITVLITRFGFRAWIAAAASNDIETDLVEALRQSAVYARGPKAIGAAIELGLDTLWAAPSEKSSEIRDRLLATLNTPQRIVIQLDGKLGTTFWQPLRDAGYEVIEIPTYEWVFPLDLHPAERLINAVCDRRVDAITFTSRPAVEHFFALAEKQQLRQEVLEAFSSDVRPFCIGRICADFLLDYGEVTPYMPDRARLGALIQIISTTFAATASEIVLAGHRIHHQGGVVTMNGHTISLSERERAVFSILARRPGAVVSKRVILQQVWGDEDTDEHRVEVTVARLRRRLGPAGAGIQTALRRGYRLAAE